MNRYQGAPQHEVGRRDARLLRRGGALRADQPRLQFDADRQQLRHARMSSTPATSGRRSCSARSTTRRRRGWCRCRTRICAATPRTSRTTSHVSDRLTLNLGLRWEFEPGPTDPQNRLSQRLDLTSPIPEMQATPPAIPAQARQLMASKGYSYTLQRRMDLRERGQPERVAQHAVELPAARRRELPPRRRFGAARRLRALPDADQQRARHARRLRQSVHRLRADDDHARPGQRRAAADARESVPLGGQPGDRAVRAGLRPLHRPGRRGRASTSTSCGRRSTIASTCSYQKAGLGEHDRRRAATSSTSARACRTTST